MAQALETALSNHDHSKRSSDIPLFYGTKDKDTVNPQQLVDRIERAAAISNWDAAIGNGADAGGLGEARGAKRRADELYLCLRGKAISWFHTLEHIPGFNNANWDALKKEFLDAYAPRYTARTLCVTLQELRLRTNLGRFSIVKKNYRKIIVIGPIIGSGKIDSLGRIESIL